MLSKFTIIRFGLVTGVLLLTATARPALANSITIDFNGLPGSQGSAFTQYTESCFTVSPSSGAWLVGQNYIYFATPAGMTQTDSIAVSEGGSTFSFSSNDLYSSVTTIPYTFTGLLDDQTAFSVSGTLPWPMGNFVSVLNPDSTKVIDTLEVTLTNPPGSCPTCDNSLGLDNIAVVAPGRLYQSRPCPHCSWLASLVLAF